jgi:hypothetical protein
LRFASVAAVICGILGPLLIVAGVLKAALMVYVAVKFGADGTVPNTASLVQVEPTPRNLVELASAFVVGAGMCWGAVRLRRRGPDVSRRGP